MEATQLIRSEKRDMVLYPGLELVVDTRKRTWTEKGRSAVRDMKSIDAIDYCSVVTCPRHTSDWLELSRIPRMFFGGGVQGRRTAGEIQMPLWQSQVRYGMVALVKVALDSRMGVFDHGTTVPPSPAVISGTADRVYVLPLGSIFRHDLACIEVGGCFGRVVQASNYDRCYDD